MPTLAPNNEQQTIDPRREVMVPVTIFIPKGEIRNIKLNRTTIKCFELMPGAGINSNTTLSLKVGVKGEDASNKVTQYVNQYVNNTDWVVELHEVSEINMQGIFNDLSLVE